MVADTIRSLFCSGFSIRVFWDTRFQCPIPEYQVNPQHDNDWLDNSDLFQMISDYAVERGL